MAYVKFVTSAFSAAYPSLDKPHNIGLPSNAYEVTAILQQDETETLKALPGSYQSSSTC